MNPTRQPRNSRILVIMTILVAVGFLFIPILLAEAMVRARQYIKYGHIGTVEDIFYQDDSTGLRRIKPNIRQKEIQINSQGFRSPEIPLIKPTGTVRLAFLGASTTFSAEVSSNQLTWPYLVVEQLASTRPDANFDFVSAAVPGYSASSSLEIFKRKISQYNPDIIIIYHAVNDLAKNSRELALAQGIVGTETFYRQDRLAKVSLLWLLIKKNLTIMLRQKSVISESSTKLQAHPTAYSGKFHKELAELVIACKQSTKAVFIPTFSYRLRRHQSEKEQLNASKVALYYMPYMDLQGFHQAHEAFNHIIRKVVAETGVHLIPGENTIPGDGHHFNDHVHFTVAGSRLMARRVVDFLLHSPAVDSIISASNLP